MNKASQNTSKISQSTHKSIKALCSQSPFLIINTPCGVGKYKFNRIFYNFHFIENFVILISKIFNFHNLIFI